MGLGEEEGLGFFGDGAIRDGFDVWRGCHGSIFGGVASEINNLETRWVSQAVDVQRREYAQSVHWQDRGADARLLLLTGLLRRKCSGDERLTFCKRLLKA